MTAPIPPEDTAQPDAAEPARGARRFVGYLASAGELVAAHRFREAEIEILRALSGGSSNPRALNLLALVRFKLGRLEEARATYREIASLTPKDAAVRRNLGLLALKSERFDEAIAELELAARLDPGERRAWGYLGYAYARRGDIAPAVHAFRRAGQEAIARELEENARRAAAAERAAAADDADRPTPYDEPSALIPRPGSQQPPAQPLAAAASELGVQQPALLSLAPSRAQAAPVPVVSFALAALGLSVAADPDAARGRAAPVRLPAQGGVHVRAGAALASLGDLPWEPALRRIRGRSSGEVLGSAARPFYRLSGEGEVCVAGAGNHHVALALDDDILYVREDRVLAFDGGVSWEAGRIPGEGLRMLQFRGRGRVVVELHGAPAAIRVSDVAPARVARGRLLGWVGRIVARRGHDQGPLPIECEGEGVILLEAPRRRRRSTRRPAARAAAGGGQAGRRQG